MSTISNKLTDSYQETIYFLKSTDFTKAILLGIAITFPIVIAVYLDHLEIGLALAIGALLSSPSDVSGSFRNKNIGILMSAAFAVMASLLGGYFKFSIWLTIPFLGVVMFAISYFSVYGFRASLVSFSGLFALVLSFANISNVLEIYERAILIGIGGVWYLLLTVIWHKWNPRALTEQFLSQGLLLTSEYLSIRGKLLAAYSDREALQKRLFDIQNELNINHETLRDILISSRKSSGTSNFERRRLLTFIQLVDVLELAMANPVNYDRMDELLLTYPEKITMFQNLILEMSIRLKQISTSILNSEDLKEGCSLEDFLKVIETDLDVFKNSEQNELKEGLILLINLYDYQQKQVEKIIKIERILSNHNLRELGFVKKIEAQRFINHQEYDPKILLENFSLKSPIFKHSLRLALVVMVGYAIGAYFSVQNAYWILLTIIVIMRPNYGLTKERSKQRILGTLFGGIIATGIVLLFQNTTLYAILAIVCLVLAFSMVQRNYKTSATFITLSVVFIYALLVPDVLNVIQFRVIDTMIGAGLAALGNAILWPSWELFNIRAVITDSLKANKDYLLEIQKFYQDKGELPTSYKLSRKQAFLTSGNLSAAFQRMTQEPKSKQVQLDKFYELIVLNHTFLSSLASMGTYIQNHSTTKASTFFNDYIKGIEDNMDHAVAIISNLNATRTINSETKLAAQDYFEKRFKTLNKTYSEELNFNKSGEINKTTQLQEVHLITEQLKWLYALSEKLIKRLSIIKFPEN